MKILWNQLGEELVAASTRCRNELILVAPFMKQRTVINIIEKLPSAVSLTCLTRWRIEEIAAGVSDLECWDIISSRANSRMRLAQNLHTKYYRFDRQAYLGSANLTMTALGWSKHPNREAMVEIESSDACDLDQFELSLFGQTIEVTSALYSEFKSLASSFEVDKLNLKYPEGYQETYVQDRANGGSLNWIPVFRSPEYLYQIYIGNVDVISKYGIYAALDDLSFLDLPDGLSEVLFNKLVRSRLVQTSVVVSLDKFILQKRRFGEVRGWLKKYLKTDDATDDWQRLMRWLLYFFPDKYQAITRNYSEIFGYIK